MSATDPNLLVPPLGPCIRYALVKARRDGKTLSLVSGYRSYQDQVGVRRANCGSSDFDIYQKSASDCDPPTAKPGSSNHQKGKAADMAGAKEWCATLLAPFHIGRPVSGEDWHFEWTGTSAETDLAALGRAVKAEGFTDAERLEVVGVDQSGVLNDDGGNWLTNARVVYVPGLGSVTIGDIVGLADSVGSSIAGAIPGGDTLAAVARVASNLIDPAFWRRLGLGALGIVVALVGLVLIFRDTITSASPIGAITKAVSQ